MKKNNLLEEEFCLNIEISEKSSELIMKLEAIIKNDITTHKLPKEIINVDNKPDEI